MHPCAAQERGAGIGSGAAAAMTTLIINITLRNQCAPFEIEAFLCETRPRLLKTALKLQPQP
jgi:hypothetical protein